MHCEKLINNYKKQYKQEDVDQWVIEHKEYDAAELFDEMLPKHRAKLNRLDKRIRAVLEEIQKVFPDAQYYTASGGFNLLLGHSHSDDRIIYPQYQRMVWGGQARIGDGDW